MNEMMGGSGIMLGMIVLWVLGVILLTIMIVLGSLGIILLRRHLSDLARTEKE